jgi:hypothetical protein
VLLIVIGIAGMSGKLRPDGAVQAITFFAFGGGMIALGLWFLIRRKPGRGLRRECSTREYSTR